MIDRRMVKLSKFLALILRHQPERFALALDEEGWASLSEVMEIVQGLPNFRWATRSDVMAVVEGKTGDGKRRFEVEGGRIRARYGHSIDQPVRYDPCSPPSLLYHGTSPAVLEGIRQGGLRPMERQYVHLSPDRGTAHQVGGRHVAHEQRPVVLTILAAKAHEAGIQFFRAGETVYLVERVPPAYIQFPADPSATG